MLGIDCFGGSIVTNENKWRLKEFIVSVETDQLQAVVENRDQAVSVIEARAELQRFYLATTSAKV